MSTKCTSPRDMGRTAPRGSSVSTHPDCTPAPASDLHRHATQSIRALLPICSRCRATQAVHPHAVARTQGTTNTASVRYAEAHSGAVCKGYTLCHTWGAYSVSHMGAIHCVTHGGHTLCRGAQLETVGAKAAQCANDHAVVLLVCKGKRGCSVDLACAGDAQHNGGVKT